MSNTHNPTSNLHLTRKQLDELDVLVQKMLNLPEANIPAEALRRGETVANVKSFAFAFIRMPEYLAHDRAINPLHALGAGGNARSRAAVKIFRIADIGYRREEKCEMEAPTFAIDSRSPLVPKLLRLSDLVEHAAREAGAERVSIELMEAVSE